MITRSFVFFKRHLLLMVCLLVAIFFRFIFLDKIPVTVTGDELFYLLTAKLAFLSKTAWNPVASLFFLYPQHQFIQAELPYFLAPYYWLPIPFSLFSAHFSTALLSVLSVLFIYLITKELCNKPIGIIAGFVAAVNPWFIVIGRTFYEMNAALLFFLITFYIILKAKYWHILWTIPFFLLAFYSYIGTKIIALPFLLICIGYTYFFVNKKRFFIQYAVVLGTVLLFMLFYAFMLTIHPSTSRLNEILLPTNPVFAAQVNQWRKTTIAYPLISIFENKIVAYLFTLIAKVFTTVSFDYLFMNGDLFFGQGHGLFYVIDAFFLFAGMLIVFKKNTKLALLLCTFSMVSLIPQILHSPDLQTFTPHIMLLFPFLIMFIANGIYIVITGWKQQQKMLIMGVFVGCAYLFFVGNFFTAYLFRSPLANTTDFANRTVSRYIALASQTKKVIVYSQSTADLFRKYLFYANALNAKNVDSVESMLDSGNFVTDNVQFLGCEKKLPFNKNQVVIVYSDECGGPPVSHGLQIAQLSDGGGKYTLLHDAVCQGVALSSYPMNIHLSDFGVEKLPQQTFCQKFVSTY